MKKLFKKSAALLTAALLALSLLSGCQTAGTKDQTGGTEKTGGEPVVEKVTMVLDWTPNTNHTGLYAAQEKGYYKEAGLEVEIVQPPEGDALLFVGTGKAPFCIAFQESIAAGLALEDPMPMTAVAAVVNHNTTGILSLKEKNITSFKDLEGKNYGTWDIPVYDEILKDVVTSDGGDFSKVNMVPNNATDTVTALQTDFDAVWVFYGWDGVISKLQGLETNYLPFIDENPVLDYYTPVIAANNDYLAAHPETARKFMEATAKGYEFAAANPAEAAEILLKAAPEIGEDVAKASQAYLSAQYLAEAPVWGVIDRTRWDNFFSWMYDKGLLTKKLEPGAGMDNSFLPKTK